jgi:hypothetical protein
LRPVARRASACGHPCKNQSGHRPRKPAARPGLPSAQRSRAQRSGAPRLGASSVGASRVGASRPDRHAPGRSAPDRYARAAPNFCGQVVGRPRAGRRGFGARTGRQNARRGKRSGARADIAGRASAARGGPPPVRETKEKSPRETRPCRRAGRREPSDRGRSTRAIEKPLLRVEQKGRPDVGKYPPLIGPRGSRGRTGHLAEQPAGCQGVTGPGPYPLRNEWGLRYEWRGVSRTECYWVAPLITTA